MSQTLLLAEFHDPRKQGRRTSGFAILVLDLPKRFESNTPRIRKGLINAESFVVRRFISNRNRGI